MDIFNIKELSREELNKFCTDEGLPAYRVKQLLHWLYEKRAQSFDDITVFSEELRARLKEKAYISSMEIIDVQTSTDGTEKLLLELDDNETIECVLIPAEERMTLCVSSQVGCAMQCTFCRTGTGGLVRNLKAYEIFEQLVVAKEHSSKPITNIVMMGMGEPLMNFDEVKEAIALIMEFHQISQRKVTVSTCGVVPFIQKLAQIEPQINLAVSLNASSNETRDKIMPVNMRHPLEDLMEACRNYPLKKNRRITFEYVVIRNINDSVADAKRLIKLIKGIPCIVNLISLNPFEGSDLEAPDEQDVAVFQEVLMRDGIITMHRKSMGQDILAACGQLRGKDKEEDTD
ncbi:23S rRNA (adenine(2503)-C(2))-methyltransferase RlmN [Nitrospirota bacterium]